MVGSPLNSKPGRGGTVGSGRRRTQRRMAQRQRLEARMLGTTALIRPCETHRLATCLGCMSDATSPSFSDNIYDCTCDPGFYRSSDLCVKCPDGFIQDGTDDSTCISCNPDTYENEHTSCNPCSTGASSGYHATCPSLRTPCPRPRRPPV